MHNLKKIALLMCGIVVVVIIISILIDLNTLKLHENNAETIIEATIESNNEATVETDIDYLLIGKDDEVIDSYVKAMNNEVDEIDTYYFINYVQNEHGSLKENASREERELIYKLSNEKEALRYMCNKNCDWSLVPHTAKDYFDEKKGLLGDFDYDTIEEIDKEKSEDQGYIMILAKKDNIERKYRISYSYTDGCMQKIYVNLEEEKNLETGEIKGKEKKLFTENNIKSNFETLCVDGQKHIVYPQEEWDGTYIGDDIAVTDNFRSKYKHFLDLFIHYSPLEYNNVSLIDLDIENHVATFEVDSVLECKKRMYSVKYVLDDRKYLDDAETNNIDEENYTGNTSNVIFKITFKNSNWDNLEITSDFRNKYNSTDGVFVNLDFNDAYFAEGLHKDNYSYLYCLEFKDNTKNYYSFELVVDNYENIDDVIIEDLNYGNVDMEEAKELYIKQFMSNG